MGRDDFKDKLHREDFEKVEQEEFDDDLDDYDDLRGESVDNAEVEAAAEQVRLQRATQELEPEDLDDLINVDEREREFLEETFHKQRQRPKDLATADEDEEGEIAPPPPEDDDDLLVTLIRGDTWAAPLLGAPVANAPSQQGSPWIRKPKS